MNNKKQIEKAKQIYNNYKDDFNFDIHGNYYSFKLIDEKFVIGELFKALTYIFEKE